MKRARYICIEGTEGVGKTTQSQKLVEYLRDQGYLVLHTKEPGTPLAPITMALRGLMLDRQHDDALTPQARELISQAIRSIHMDKIIVPAISQYDFIVQDRGILSGWAYGAACGNSLEVLSGLTEYVTETSRLLLSDGVYDDLIYLRGDPTAGLIKAKQAKQEFVAGDAMEAKGDAFMREVSANMDSMIDVFNTKIVNVDGKNIEEVFAEILQALNIEE